MPSFLQFVCLLTSALHGKHSLSWHLLGLKGSDFCKILFICLPAFSITLMFMLCFFMILLYSFCRVELGVAVSYLFPELMVVTRVLHSFVHF